MSLIIGVDLDMSVELFVNTILKIIVNVLSLVTLDNDVVHINVVFDSALLPNTFNLGVDLRLTIHRSINWLSVWLLHRHRSKLIFFRKAQAR